MMTSLVWFRLDLRLTDNPALQRAVNRGGAVIPVFVWAPEEEAPWEPGGASRWWLHQSLAELDRALRERGSRLILRRGPAGSALRQLAKETGATAVYWNRRYEPAVIARDARLKEELRAEGLAVESANGALLHEPWTIENQSGKPFRVFTPFWKKCLAQPDPPEPVAAPARWASPGAFPRSLALAALELEPRMAWAAGLAGAWQPGESGALSRLQRVRHGALAKYAEQRNRPDLEGTSRLSPHLHFGEISPRQVWHAAVATGDPGARRSTFLAEVGWREFAHHLLFHCPETPTEPLRPEFRRFPWRRDAAGLRAWQRGRTGYPIVDAGMRELWATGWMHNRVRMIVASFLVKDLRISWTEGAAWFWDTLVDADLAQNTLGWQWTAGCGADAAPYFRIFNPVRQGETFDPEGAYVRRWCPELARLPGAFVHQPWEASAEVLAQAGVVLGKTYPAPVIAHAIAREVALEAYQRIRSSPAGDEAGPQVKARNG